VLVFILMLGSVSQEADVRPNCTSPRSQLEINACAYVRYQRADEELNRQWKLTLAKARQHPEEQRPELHGGMTDAQLLIEAQKAWIAFRDAQCAFEKTYMPGSGGPAMEADCLQRLTLARTRELRDTYRH
jgi:uncharacterized protein YecT (DUF1311 family)